MAGVDTEDDFKKDIAQFLGGMKRTVIKAKIESEESLDKGKKPMLFEVYNRLCKLLFQGEVDDYLFAHAVLTLDWNLLAWSDNCFGMAVNHVQWSGD
eukprot:14616942-Ditylum_brightwellii.AAC.1